MRPLSLSMRDWNDRAVVCTQSLSDSTDSSLNIPSARFPALKMWICPCFDSQSESLDQIPNNVAHTTEGKMARVGRKGKRHSKARKKRKRRRSKSQAQAGVASAKPLPRTPEQESCTVPVQVRPPTTVLVPALGVWPGTCDACVFPAGR